VPEEAGDGDGLTDGDGDTDGEWLGVTLDAFGVGTGGTGHRQLGAATGTGEPGTAFGRCDGGTVRPLRGSVTEGTVPNVGAGLEPAAGGTEPGRPDSRPASPLLTPT
jgi:hypothetical protein